MSRSTKRTPIMGMTGDVSEKRFKQDEHQRERTHVRRVLRTTADDTAIDAEKAYGNSWGGPKDGKQYLRDAANTAAMIAGPRSQADAKCVARERHKLQGK